MSLFNTYLEAVQKNKSKAIIGEKKFVDKIRPDVDNVSNAEYGIFGDKSGHIYSTGTKEFCEKKLRTLEKQK